MSIHAAPAVLLCDVKLQAAMLNWHFSVYNKLAIMSALPLSSESEEHIRSLFTDDERELVRSLLATECGNNLPGLERLTPKAMDRWRFAVLTLSDGDLSKFEQALDLARTDWRDLLMAAGFGENLTAHESWRPTRNHG